MAQRIVNLWNGLGLLSDTRRHCGADTGPDQGPTVCLWLSLSPDDGRSGWTSGADVSDPGRAQCGPGRRNASASCPRGPPGVCWWVQLGPFRRARRSSSCGSSWGPAFGAAVRMMLIAGPGPSVAGWAVLVSPARERPRLSGYTARGSTASDVQAPFDGFQQRAGMSALLRSRR